MAWAAASGFTYYLFIHKRDEQALETLSGNPTAGHDGNGEHRSLRYWRIWTPQNQDLKTGCGMINCRTRFLFTKISSTRLYFY